MSCRRLRFLLVIYNPGLSPYNTPMDLSFEKGVWKKGKKVVFGIDEAGRGPLAGPVTACAVTIQPIEDEIRDTLNEVDDSKRLSAEKREELYNILTDHPHVFWEVSWVTPRVIDRINILEATRRAMKRALERLGKKIGRSPDFVFTDGRMELEIDFPQEGIPKGDRRVFSCAAASVLAKVFRDRTMRRYHRLFPVYRFDLHKGYATELHRRRIKEHGPCRIHRRSFEPLKSCPGRT